ncbi:DUF202 domain-containing protein [Segniliparus rugosus]|uniref:DUF202 domain-containing protein n=1 Tax=Segniliparus rugosus (strain ATCC BAA-974 / DSM 45345 / CCUG 50838 / CIP 108380 / JCM 13579 / CDC 945) TaxID=679197 RepID=E5XUB1_SEGRC|nr:DUF202 domain-containing protein [Segniliparus rugosus]EFV12052.1 hypothetical protein HMPREF9336_03083 [Segniliparus rugosus ATCC BAA-974]
MTDANGLAAERVVLAWSRTSLAVFGNAGLLALREWTCRPGPVGAFAALLVVMCVAGFCHAALRRGRALRRARPSPAASPKREVRLVGGCVLALSLVCALAI